MSTLACRPLPWALSSIVLLALGCTPDAPETGDGSGTEASSGDTGNTGETGETTAVADDTGTTTGDAADVPARAVRISLVETNSGVAVPVGRDGEWVDGSGRNAPIPRLRDTLFRVRVDVDDAAWVPRELEARISLHQLDGTVDVVSGVAMITADSAQAEDALDSTFMLVVPAEMMQPFVQFEVELFEAAPTGWEGLPEPDPAAPRLPADGPNFVGVEDGELVMRVMLVPVQYESAACTATFDTSPEVIAAYEEAMYQQNPVERVELEVHEPYVVDDLNLADANDFFTLLNRIQQLRAGDQPDPNVYYYGIFDNCAQCIGFGGLPGCVLGVAAGLPDDSMGSAGERVAIGAIELDAPDGSGLLDIGATTFVHEVGHTQGRQHVACPGVQAGGPDPTYPHPEGQIGAWGWGTRDGQIRVSEGHTDYMSYCSPVWASDWQWEATFQRIRTLSSWDASGMGAVDQQAVLVGSIDPVSGEATWWTDRGWVTRAAADHVLRYVGEDGAVEEVPVQVSPWSEGPRMTVRAPLTEAFERAKAVELVSPGRTYRAERGAVTVYHRADRLTQ
ncbi:hypothetical protein [Paraliomyxa miuraensis]|uniref:hypothetical protein n=1 Tax=Paraliomyxa miuraensis TaxID=376150 RepID=UPI00224D8596|nr:hypothetical protein [Paraliomyxa miuraensis]MCX4241178.1 hypothetical protein [Paraliomyxa miuraensis]